MRSKKLYGIIRGVREGIPKSNTLFFGKATLHEAIWEPEENLQNAPKNVEEYYRRVEGNTVLKEGSM